MNYPTMTSRIWRYPRVVLSNNILVLALVIIATAIISTEAVKLTSLGSTFEHTNVIHNKNIPPIVDKNDDLSSMACSPSNGDSDGGDASSSLATCTSTYGVDSSFPIHRPLPLPDMSDVDYSQLMPWHIRQLSKYDNFIEGCQEWYGKEAFKCDGSEEERMAMNLRQPPSMVNYTTLGFHKTRAPQSMMTLLTKFWNQRFTSISQLANETWSTGDTYTNHWESPTKMLNLGKSSLRKSIWDASKPLLEDWAGAQLSPTSLYGVRVYTEGAILAPHVDRLPLVISAIVNVAQDVDEPWPLEVYGHDGNAYNITMEPGDMVFYESHSIIHGRPFPLHGRYYGNVFIHFEPIGHALQHEEEHTQVEENEESLAQLYEKAWKKLQTKCSDDEECKARVDLNVDRRVPHYIVPGSEEEWRWVQTHPKARVDTSNDKEWVKTLNAHTAASNGDLDALIALASKDPNALKHKDNNGWNPLHEAVRGGHVNVAKFLLSGGLDKNERTHNGNGGSPLWWAKKTHGHKHPMVQYLESIGAEEIPPAGHEKIKEKD